MSNNELTCAIPAARLAEVVEKLRRNAAIERNVAAYAAEDAARFRITLEELEIGLRFLERAGKGRALHQAVEICRDVLVRLAERHHLVRVEQRRRRGAVGHAEGVAHGPGARSPSPARSGRRRSASCALRLLHAVRVVLARRTQPVDDDLLHRLVHVEIVEAVAQARLPREVRVRRHEPRRARIVLRQIFDDDASTRGSSVLALVAQHRELADRPELHERRARRPRRQDRRCAARTACRSRRARSAPSSRRTTSGWK